MAEKEERIWIGTTEKKIQLKQMTRKEAIEKIATHLRASTLLMDSDPEVYAEIALNALLED